MNRETISLTIKNSSDKFTALKFGLDTSATDLLDTALGEMELPPFQPPNSLYAVFYVNDTPEHLVWSYLDYKPYQPGDYTSATYHFEIMGSDNKPFTISWNPPSANFDTIKIFDIYTGTLVNASLKDSGSVFVKNPTIASFDIYVKYRNAQVGVVDEKENVEQPNIFPNPTSDFIMLDKFEEISLSGNYIIYNDYGNTVKEGKFENGKVYVKELNNGMYFVKIFENNKYQMLKFIKY